MGLKGNDKFPLKKGNIAVGNSSNFDIILIINKIIIINRIMFIMKCKISSNNTILLSNKTHITFVSPKTFKIKIFNIFETSGIAISFTGECILATTMTMCFIDNGIVECSIVNLHI